MATQRLVAGLSRLLAALALVGALAGCQDAQGQAPSTWPMQVGGAWYSDDSRQLGSELDRWLADAGRPAGAPARPDPRRVLGLIAPHAGYRFSGPSAAQAYERLRGSGVRTAIILGPAHRHALRGAVLLPHEQLATPFGPLAIDRELAATIARLPHVSVDARPYAGEHSIEMQLPLLARVLPGVRVVPLLVGRLSPEEAATLGAGLSGLLRPGERIAIASSDFTHYGPSYGYLPFTDDVPARLAALDGQAYERIAALDRLGFEAYLRQTGATVCGARPIAVLLAALPAGSRVERLAYTTSGDLLRDHRNSVSYLAIGFWAGGG